VFFEFIPRSLNLVDSLCCTVILMEKSLDSLNEIVPGRLTWRIKVRVVRMWEVPTFLKMNQANSLELVLLDQMVCVFSFIACV
jgi:hypothetical protein